MASKKELYSTLKRGYETKFVYRARPADPTGVYRGLIDPGESI